MATFQSTPPPHSTNGEGAHGDGEKPARNSRSGFDLDLGLSESLNVLCYCVPNRENNILETGLDLFWFERKNEPEKTQVIFRITPSLPWLLVGKIPRKPSVIDGIERTVYSFGLGPAHAICERPVDSAVATRTVMHAKTQRPSTSSDSCS